MRVYSCPEAYADVKFKRMKSVITSVWVGVLTLGIEILAGRLLAPFFGSSLHQWAALIGVALLAYVVGYAAYARLTRWGPSIPLAAGGFYLLSFPLWLYPGVDALLGLPFALATVIGAIFVVGVPSVLWASILPYLQHHSEPGRGARILSWSAAGNLIGVWGVAFVGVPVIGTRMTLGLLGVLALVLALIWIKESMALGRVVIGLFFVGGALLFSLGPSSARRNNTPWEFTNDSSPTSVKKLLVSRDSAYQHIAVWDETEGGDTRRVLALNNNVQFLWNEREKLTAGIRYEYYNFTTAAALWSSPARAKNVLILGLGGGLIPWQLRGFFPDIDITTFELDPGVARAAAEVLPFAKSGKSEVRLGDGRILMKNDTKKYDYVLLDTFLNSYVPFHLTTREFFDLVRLRLNPGGILVANFHTVFASSGLLPKLEATIRSVFPSVAVVSLPAGTTLIMAAPDMIPWSERLQPREGQPRELVELSQRALDTMRPATAPDQVDGDLLTDDHNDTEQRLYETRKLVVVSRTL